MIAFRKRQTAIDLTNRFDIAFAVLADVRQLSRAKIRIYLGAVEAFFGRWNSERASQKIQAHVVAPPFAPFMHCVVDRIVTESSHGDLARRFDPIDDRTLVDKPQIEIENIVAHEQVAIRGKLPEAADDFGFAALQNLDGGILLRFDRVGQA